MTKKWVLTRKTNPQPPPHSKNMVMEGMPDLYIDVLLLTGCQKQKTSDKEDLPWITTTFERHSDGRNARSWHWRPAPHWLSEAEDSDTTEVTSVKHEKEATSKSLWLKKSSRSQRLTIPVPLYSIQTSESQDQVKEDKQQIHSWSGKKGTHLLHHDLNERSCHWYRSLSKWNETIEEVRRNKILIEIKQVTYSLHIV